MSEVLALKYRPQDFNEIIGQETVVKQLEAALDKGTLGHALLLCGTRGSGKTTSARIIARKLNSKIDEGDWKAVSSLVVTEIDAASNTGVDNVRELIESIRYSTHGHRVVILDEAHMLSKNAFNALLKTLEEPPPDVTFILLTTEPHKLIPTVVSRCQKYEFQDVSVETLTEYYEKICKLETINHESGFPHEVALKAEGSVRDGLTILQKYLSGELAETSAGEYFDLVSAIYQRDSTTALDLVNNLRRKEDSRVIIQNLEKWFYWCSLENFGMKTPARPFFPGEGILEFDLPHLQNLFETCLEVERNFSATPNSKIVLEMGILRLCL